jgi:PIN domain
VRVIVPSIVAAELLYDLPPERHESFLAALSRNFIVAPFDMKAASAFSKLWRERRTDGTVKALQNDAPVRTRTELKADAMIIATVISRGAREFYSHDDGVVKIAGPRLPVYKIPVIAEQTDLFPERALKLVAQPPQKPGGGSTS